MHALPVGFRKLLYTTHVMGGKEILCDHGRYANVSRSIYLLLKRCLYTIRL